MRRSLLYTVLLSLYSLFVSAQDLDRIQIHGFATQGFLFSSQNNYLTMRSSSGSLQWTEGAISLNDAVTEKLRVGVQLHMYQMGDIGGPEMLVDWASGDYQFSDWLGVRAGKVKVPLGLFNDSQDVDSLFLWTLLPQSNYPDDNRDFDLAVLGGELYGHVNLPKGIKLGYRGYGGESRLDKSGGYLLTLSDNGFTFPNPPSGKAFGGDIRVEAPWKGLMLGTSAETQGLDGIGPEGTLHVAPAFITAYYAEWKKGRWYFAGEYWRLAPIYLLQTGDTQIAIPIDQRSWYPMASYRVTKKLQIGTYHSHYINKAADTRLPENYSKDLVISGRYDFNDNFYGKIETHILHGTGIGYYLSSNPKGLRPNSTILAARVGFTF